MLRHDLAPCDLWRKPLSVADFNQAIFSRLKLRLDFDLKLNSRGMVDFAKLKRDLTELGVREEIDSDETSGEEIVDE